MLKRLLLPVTLLLMVGCGGGGSSTGTPEPTPSPSPTPSPTPTPTPGTDSDDFTFTTLSEGHSIPWAIEIINEDEFVFTERLGKLFHHRFGETVEITGLPATATVKVEYLTFGGYMDVSLHPEYADNGLIYLAYVAANHSMYVARFTLQDGTAENFEVVFRSNAFSIGSRIAWQDSEHFFVTQGLGGNPHPVPGAQDLTDDGGKIHRLKADGSIPDDNPIFPGFTQPGSIWSYGHRDPQGLFYDEHAEQLLSNEHGPLGGDELNVVEKSGNYGWPLFSYGLNYDRTPVSDLTEAEAAEFTVLPMKYWGENFNMAPSTLVKLENSNFASWNGKFLMGALAMQSIVSYDAISDVTEVVMEDIGRVRDIAQLPSGDLLILIDRRSPNTDDTGRVVKISPK